MKLLPILFSSQQNIHQINQSCHTNVTFQANSKEYAKLIEQSVTDTINKTQDLSGIMNNPQKKNMFIGVLSSLIVGAATAIVNLVGDNSDEVDKAKKKMEKNEDGDVIEIHTTKQAEENTLNKIQKHRGKQSRHEAELLDKIQKISSSQNLSPKEANPLIDLYNEFCGLNVKNYHYSTTNEKILNQQIAENLISDLQNCDNKEKLVEIILRYQQYSKEPKAQVESLQEKPKKLVVPPNADEETVKIVQNLKKLKEVYYNIGNDDTLNNNLPMVENFIKEISAIQKTQNIKNIYLSKINTHYSDYLLKMAQIYSDLKDNSEQKQKFLASLGNKLLSKTALQNWKNIQGAVLLNFNEYNSMVKANLDEKIIREIAKQKCNAKIKSIEVEDLNNFSICLNGTNIGKNFYTINNIFKTIHKEDYTPLTDYNEHEWTLYDVESEIKKNYSSYPNLSQYLTIQDKPYYNRGKIQDLLDLYKGHNQNQQLFTLHSYLRFIERVVLEHTDCTNEADDYIYCKTLDKNYIEAVKSLKEGLKVLSQQPINVSTYYVENIQAPQFKIPVVINDKQLELTLTVNANNKIHTLF